MQPRSVLQGILRGARGRCPNCDESKLFYRYLKVQPECGTCGHDNGRYRADDAPPYFTIFLVGHLVIAPLLVFPWVWEAHPALVLGATLPALAILSMLLLPVVKGGVVGLHWAVDDRRKGEPEPRSETVSSLD